MIIESLLEVTFRYDKLIIVVLPRWDKVILYSPLGTTVTLSIEQIMSIIKDVLAKKNKELP